MTKFKVFLPAPTVAKTPYKIHSKNPHDIANFTANRKSPVSASNNYIAGMVRPNIGRFKK